ncbi:hypothetical protein SteCoe_6087 [Stentor coeruleus]|uniref:UBX domain-containing protein n=1 Tax=Stentor coeruleus TaxID=5963 RepID=A0A1R2CQW9_9CILI|nr:hypothetical protein SteCoe_6087 [Stentor coeruleus]
MASPLNLHIGGRDESKSAYEESEEISGQTLHLIIQLPDGRSIEDNFKSGVNVEWVLYQVANKTELDFNSLELMIENVKLLRPLSLSDYPNITNGAILRVVVRE